MTALDATSLSELPPAPANDADGLDPGSLDRALRAAREHLVGLQDPAGWWKGELETNVTMDAEDLMMRHFLGILDPAQAQAAASWIFSNQRDDGTWATFFGGPGDLSTTVEAYVALRLAGQAPDDERLARASQWVRDNGGIEATRVFTRIWLAMVGAWDWDDLPVVPPEILYLPASAPLNIYDFGCWARQTVVALTVVFSHRPVRPLPFTIDELVSPNPPQRRAKHSWRTASGALQKADDLLARYDGLPDWFLPRTWLRRAALRRAEQWILHRQEADGLWGGIQPPVVYSIIALDIQGYPIDHPVMKAALAGLDDFTIQDEKGRRVEACQSPVWDTALAVIGLLDAGAAPDDPVVDAATRWLLDKEVTAVGDWAVRRPQLAPGGWAFEFANDNYPDIDDTAEVVLALAKARPPADADLGQSIDDACRRGIAWAVGMQSGDGGWGAFDADNVSQLVASLPFCDFGEVTDPPSADVTAHVIEMLSDSDLVDTDAIQHGIDWLWAHQEPDGSWFGRWGVNYVYGTGAVVPALVAAGVPTTDARLMRAARWLEEHQNDDGGWGEDLRSYRYAEWRGRGESTASQTAWALLALIAAGRAASDSAVRGVRFLVSTQLPSGTWDEPWFTGTGFPWDFSINYHLYRLVWPLSALGRYRQAVRA